MKYYSVILFISTFSLVYGQIVPLPDALNNLTKSLNKLTQMLSIPEEKPTIQEKIKYLINSLYALKDVDWTNIKKITLIDEKTFTDFENQTEFTNFETFIGKHTHYNRNDLYTTLLYTDAMEFLNSQASLINKIKNKQLSEQETKKLSNQLKNLQTELEEAITPRLQSISITISTNAAPEEKQTIEKEFKQIANILKLSKSEPITISHVLRTLIQINKGISNALEITQTQPDEETIEVDDIEVLKNALETLIDLDIVDIKNLTLIDQETLSKYKKIAKQDVAAGIDYLNHQNFKENDLLFTDLINGYRELKKIESNLQEATKDEQWQQRLKTLEEIDHIFLTFEEKNYTIPIQFSPPHMTTDEEKEMQELFKQIKQDAKLTPGEGMTLEHLLDAIETVNHNIVEKTKEA